MGCGLLSIGKTGDREGRALPGLNIDSVGCYLIVVRWFCDTKLYQCLVCKDLCYFEYLPIVPCSMHGVDFSWHYRIVVHKYNTGQQFYWYISVGVGSELWDHESRFLFPSIQALFFAEYLIEQIP